MTPAQKLSVAKIEPARWGRTRAVPGIGTLVDVPDGLSWVHPNVAVKDAGTMGLGLVALDLIPKGQPVILFGGKLMSWKEILTLPEDMWDIPYQVSDDVFFGMHRREDIGIGEKINHSCDPNCGFSSEMTLVAIRDIAPGEDVTMDYATCSSMEGYRLQCSCGSPRCRGVILGTDWKKSELQARLYNYFQPYLKQKIKQQPHGLKRSVVRGMHRIADWLSGDGRLGLRYE